MRGRARASPSRNISLLLNSERKNLTETCSLVDSVVVFIIRLAMNQNHETVPRFHARPDLDDREYREKRCTGKKISQPISSLASTALLSLSLSPVVMQIRRRDRRSWRFFSALRADRLDATWRGARELVYY